MIAFARYLPVTTSETCPLPLDYSKYKYLTLATFLPAPVVSWVDINNNTTTPGRDLNRRLHREWRIMMRGPTLQASCRLNTCTLPSLLSPQMSGLIVMAQKENSVGVRLPSHTPLQPRHGSRIMQLQYLLQVMAAVTWPGALQRNIFSGIHTNSAEPCPAQTHRGVQSVAWQSWAEVYLKRTWGTGGPGDWCFWVNKNTFHIATL